MALNSTESINLATPSGDVYKGHRQNHFGTCDQIVSKTKFQGKKMYQQPLIVWGM